MKGRTYNFFDSSTSDKFVGVCIFVDHMSWYIHVEHHLKFSSSENIWAKQNYENLCLDRGIMVNTNIFDNSVFKAQHIIDNNQSIC